LVPEDEYGLLPFQTTILHDKVVKLKGYECNPTKNFTCKVPKDYHFLTEDYARKFTMGFPKMWHVFNVNSTDLSLVRLWALYQAK
jgi:hypothetical protein